MTEVLRRPSERMSPMQTPQDIILLHLVPQGSLQLLSRDERTKLGAAGEEKTLTRLIANPNGSRDLVDTKLRILDCISFRWHTLPTTVFLGRDEDGGMHLVGEVKQDKQLAFSISPNADNTSLEVVAGDVHADPLTIPVAEIADPVTRLNGLDRITSHIDEALLDTFFPRHKMTTSSL